MGARYTLKRLGEVENSAPRFGFGEVQESRFATEDLDAERTGVSFHRLRPGARQPFGHRHDEAEEVYVVLAGSGRVRLDDDVEELARLDALRVAPRTMRCFEAGPEGLEWIAVGARHEGDGEVVPGWWAD